MYRLAPARQKQDHEKHQLHEPSVSINFRHDRNFHRAKTPSLAPGLATPRRPACHAGGGQRAGGHHQRQLRNGKHDRLERGGVHLHHQRAFWHLRGLLRRHRRQWHSQPEHRYDRLRLHRRAGKRDPEFLGLSPLGWRRCDERSAEVQKQSTDCGCHQPLADSKSRLQRLGLATLHL